MLFSQVFTAKLPVRAAVPPKGSVIEGSTFTHMVLGESLFFVGCWAEGLGSPLVGRGGLPQFLAT